MVKYRFCQKVAYPAVSRHLGKEKGANGQQVSHFCFSTIVPVIFPVFSSLNITKQIFLFLRNFPFVIYFFRKLSWCYYTDLKLSQFIWPATRGRRNDKKIRLGVRHILYSFRDVQGLLLASAGKSEYKTPSSFKSLAIDRMLSICWWKSILKIHGLSIWESNQDLQVRPNRPGFYR